MARNKEKSEKIIYSEPANLNDFEYLQNDNVNINQMKNYSNAQIIFL